MISDRNGAYMPTPVLNETDISVQAPHTAGMFILLIVVLVLLLGGGGGFYYGRGAGWGTPHYGGGLFGLVLIVLLILFLTGHMGSGLMIR
jgi:hypothetical protein